MFTSLTNPSFLGAIFNRLGKGEQIADSTTGNTPSGAFQALLNSFKLGTSFDTHQAEGANVVAFPVMTVTPRPFVPNQQTDNNGQAQTDDIFDNNANAQNYLAGLAMPFINHQGAHPVTTQQNTIINNTTPTKLVTGFNNTTSLADAAPGVAQHGNAAVTAQPAFPQSTHANIKVAAQTAVFVPLSEVGVIPASTIVGEIAAQPQQPVVAANAQPAQASQRLLTTMTAETTGSVAHAETPNVVNGLAVNVTQTTQAAHPVNGVATQAAVPNTETAGQTTISQSTENPATQLQTDTPLAQPISNNGKNHPPVAENTIPTNQAGQVNVAKVVQPGNQVKAATQQQPIVAARIPIAEQTGITGAEKVSAQVNTAPVTAAVEPVADARPAHTSTVKQPNMVTANPTATTSQTAVAEPLSSHTFVASQATAQSFEANTATGNGNVSKQVTVAAHTETASKNIRDKAGALQTRQVSTTVAAAKSFASASKPSTGNAVHTIDLQNVAGKVDEPVRLQVSTSPFESGTDVKQTSEQAHRQTKPIKPIAGRPDIVQPRQQAPVLNPTTGSSDVKVTSPHSAGTGKTHQRENNIHNTTVSGNKKFADPLWENRIAAKQQQLLMTAETVINREIADVQKPTFANKVFVKNEIPAPQQHLSNQVVESIPTWQPIVSEPTSPVDVPVVNKTQLPFTVKASATDTQPANTATIDAMQNGVTAQRSGAGTVDATAQPAQSQAPDIHTPQVAEKPTGIQRETSAGTTAPQTQPHIQHAAEGVQQAVMSEKPQQPEASHTQRNHSEAINNTTANVAENSDTNNAQTGEQSQDAESNNLFRPEKASGKTEKSTASQQIGESFPKQMNAIAENQQPRQAQQPLHQQAVQEPIQREPLKPVRGMTLHETVTLRNEESASPVSHSETTVNSVAPEQGTVGSSSNFQSPAPSVANQVGGQPQVATQVIKFQSMAQFTSRLATALQEQVYKLNGNPQAAAQQLFIQLEPRDLGVIRLHLKMKDNKLTGKIESGTSETTAMLQSHQPHLVTRLAEMGINIQDFSISYNDQLNAQQQSFRDHAQQQQQFGHGAQRGGSNETASSGKTEQPITGGAHRPTIGKDGVDITV